MKGQQRGSEPRFVAEPEPDRDIVVFTPSLELTISIESTAGAEDRVDLHAGGRGFWISGTTHRLGCRTALCASLGGESGEVLRTLIQRTGVEFVGTRASLASACRIRDLRDVDRTSVARTASGLLARHDLDDLYGAMLATAVQARVAVLAGPDVHREISPHVYRRLTTDLEALDVAVVADVAGPYLCACVESGGATVLRTSDEELVRHGVAHSENEPDLVRALHKLGDAAPCVVVMRHDGALLVLAHGALHSIAGAALEQVDPTGAAEAVTAGIACGLAEGLPLLEAAALGAAAGMATSTRHGRAAPSPESVRALRSLVKTDEVDM